MTKFTGKTGRKNDRAYEEIPYRPGYWIDWEYPGVAIRDAMGTIIATDLCISRETMDLIEAKVRREKGLLQ